MNIELLIKATRKESNMFIVKDRLELLKVLESNDVNIIKEKLKNDIDTILTSYKYFIDNEPDNNELKREFTELQRLIT
jgi:hypothetical protein